MKKWKYLNGNDSDFNGAPEWAQVAVNDEDKRLKSFIGELNGVGLVATVERADSWWKFSAGTGRHEFIAQRQPIADEEQDLNECISSTEALIAERGTRYGKFKDGAEIMRDLKYVMHEVDGWNNLTPSQKEALDMIQHKIGRILNGDPNYDDNWKDVAGYATLIVNELNGDIK